MPTFMIACALAISPVAARAQDHQHASPDSASTEPTQMQMQMGMAGMMGHMMTTMAQMQDMCSKMMSPEATQTPTDSITPDPMGMMGQMMTTMGRMMTMMSQARPDSTSPRE
jgi:hypothetical protein